MNALLLPLSHRASFNPTGADRRFEVSAEFPDARIYLATDDALVPAWYLDTKPRRDATVIPLGRGSWNGDHPSLAAMKRARLLLESRVSVLLVDVRPFEGAWARLLGRSRADAIRAGLDYLVERGHDQDECVVDAW